MEAALEIPAANSSEEPPRIAQFNFSGFWFFGDIRFSINGTLINTLYQIITQPKAGKSNSKLEKHFGIRVQTALRTLSHSKKIAQVKLEKKFLYVNADPSIGDHQIRKHMDRSSRHSL